MASACKRAALSSAMALMWIVGGPAAHAAETAAKGPANADLTSCGPMREVATEGGRIDYRLRGVSAMVKKGVGDLDKYHTTLAIAELRTGSLYRSVKDNLDFTLRHSPNHHGALQTLIQYDRAGGKIWDFPETECYLAWAQEFAPDDGNVWLITGYHFWSRKDMKRAEAAYLRALDANSESPETHYNLGLVYVELRDYERALEHAHAAYSRGHPLPGLRQKLERAGKWREAPAATAGTSQ
jgi:tetratricopeptide (TPR) repeat protein